MADATYVPKTYHKQEGDVFVVASGGSIDIESGGLVTVDGSQLASANQAAVGAVTTVGSNTGTAGAGLSLIGDTTSVNQASNLMNDLAALQEDIAATITLVNQLRSDLVSAGIIKGAA